MKKKIILFFIPFIFTNCFTDVVENIETKTLDLRSIEEITININISNLKSITDTTEIPIIAWMGVPEKHTSTQRFQEMKDAGFNISFSNYSNADSLQKALDIAQQLNIKLMIRCPELYTNTETIVLRFKDHPANAGYFLQDEPLASAFPLLKQLVNKIESIDSTHFCYINLYPNIAFPEFYGSGYKNYVNNFLLDVPVKILSFDHYPIIGNSIRLQWYQNLEIIKSEAEIANIPFWAFALTTAHNSYPVPDMNQLRLQVYSNLAYGAKGIQYFTYWTPISQTWDFHLGPIEANGDKTVVYDYIRELNNEIQNFAYIFKSTEVINVSHYRHNPLGTFAFVKPPSFIKSLKIRGGSALLSEMINDKNAYLMIQNNNLNKEIGIDIKTDAQTKVVLKNGLIINASIISEEFKLTPGDMVIFMN